MVVASRAYPAAPRHVWVGGYWAVLALAVMPAVALCKPLEFFGLVVIAATITIALFFPKLRAPALVCAILLFPRTMEFDPTWSWVFGLREPAKDVKLVAVLSLLDLAIVVTALAVLLPKLFRRERIESFGNGWGLAFAAVYLCSVVLAWGTYGDPHFAEFTAIANLIRAVLVWLVFVNSENDAGRTARLGLGFIAAALVACGSGVQRQMFSGPMSMVEQWESRAEAFNLNANAFSAAMVMLGLLGLALWCKGTRRQRWLGAFCFAAGAVGAGFALSRAGIAVFALLATAMMFRHRRSLLVLWLAVVAAAVAYALTTPDINGRIALFQSGKSVMDDQVRMQVHEQTFGMVSDHLLLGVGPYRYYDASIPYVPTGIVRNVAHGHCMPLQVLVDTGIFGTLFGFLLFAALVRHARRNLKSELPGGPWRIGAAYGLTGVLVMMLTDSLLLDFRFLGAFLAVLAILVAAPKPPVAETRVDGAGAGARAIRSRPRVRRAA